jgi:hypothetical protein
MASLEARWRLEISAGILAVAIEKEIVNPPIDVVMVRDVPARQPDRVALMQAAQNAADLQRDLHPGRRRNRGRIAEHQRQEIIDGALLDREAAVHIAFPDRQIGVEHQPERRPPVPDADDDLVSGAVAIGELAATWLANRQAPGLDHVTEHPTQAHQHGTLFAKSTPPSPARETCRHTVRLCRR